MKVNLGGDRIGSGNKMQIRLRHYERSTHNLSKKWTSTMGIGQLIPCTVTAALRGDKFDFNLSAGVRTIPSKGAMFGTYKLQLDYYLCPVRLYTGILHNNPVRIAMDMDKVYFPQMKLNYIFSGTLTSFKKMPFHTSSLLHYLGLSGMGCTKRGNSQIQRDFDAIPVLAYYDIFKNYYSNKQEIKAYVLSGSDDAADEAYMNDVHFGTELATEYIEGSHQGYSTNTPVGAQLQVFGGLTNLEGADINITITYNNETFYSGTLVNAEVNEYIEQLYMDDTSFMFRLTDNVPQTAYLTIWTDYYYKSAIDDVNAIAFDLTNIDKMRAELLSHHTMGIPYYVNNFNDYPYKAICDRTNAVVGKIKNTHALDGIMLKTYQSDMFNNWLATEYIDGVNGIANITKVKVEGGGFTIDSLNYAEKMYDLLNRIVISGNTYEDWQNVVYEELPKRHLESPMYIGGLSQEIVFEEIISTSDTKESGGKGLGAIGGRGISRHRKGGHIRVKVDEASFIIGIISITPRVDYGQGNAFYFTDIFSMDDFHKPALDGIGFQDLIGERMAYFDTQINDGNVLKRHSIGKLPAWIEYMTAVDEVHGDFADAENENAYMVLNRNYEFDGDNGVIADATTYIDPAKYNDTFLYTNRDSQNFWVQVNHNIEARRKMSAKQIPNI